MDPAKLIQGKVYFICGFKHPKYPIPWIKNYVYVRKNAESDKNEYIFQFPQKYFEDDIKNALSDDEFKEISDPEHSGEMIMDDDNIHLVKDIDEFISWVSSLKKEKHAQNIY
jgi:hypothetical protein